MIRNRQFKNIFFYLWSKFVYGGWEHFCFYVLGVVGVSITSLRLWLSRRWLTQTGRGTPHLSTSLSLMWVLCNIPVSRPALCLVLNYCYFYLLIYVTELFVCCAFAQGNGVGGCSFDVVIVSIVCTEQWWWWWWLWLYSELRSFSVSYSVSHAPRQWRMA